MTTTPKFSAQSKYQPLQMTDESVYDMAQHYYTCAEIAARFKVSDATLMDRHGEAFHAGRDNAMNKPRMLLGKIFKDFAEAEVNFANPDIPMGTLLKATELHAKMYCGLGSTQTVITKTDDKPSVSDIKFSPLKAPE